MGEIVQSQGNEIIKLKEENQRLGDFSTDSPKGVSKVHAIANEEEYAVEKNSNGCRPCNNDVNRQSIPASTIGVDSDVVISQQAAQQ